MGSKVPMQPRRREPRLESVFQVTNSGLRRIQPGSRAASAPLGIAIVKRRQRLEAAVQRVVEDVEGVEGVGRRGNELAVGPRHSASYRDARTAKRIKGRVAVVSRVNVHRAGL